MRLVGTRDPSDTSTFLAAAAGATPAHGGLFVFDPIPDVCATGPEAVAARLAAPEAAAALPAAPETIDALLAAPWAERNARILERWIGDEIPRSALDEIVRDALSFPAPLVSLADGTFALELFHGPTLAFKDFGARFLAAVLARAPRPASRDGLRTILTATSGDTGAAVAHAFWNRPGTRVVVLYPRGRVSPLQERQIASLGGNVHTFAVEGSFDDCQALVKRAFADRALAADLGLTSANSINVARLLAQVLYYFEGLAQLRRIGRLERVVVAVPSGNFGDLCAGLWAWKSGLPVRDFVAATNANATVPEYLAGAPYRPRPSVATLSNAMDVGDPSNWERIEHLFGRDRGSLRNQIRGSSVDDVATRDEIRRLDASGYLACPHTAVAHRSLRSALHGGETGVFLATAHPAKFREVIEPVIGRAVDLPPALAALVDRPVLSRVLANDHDAFVRCLRVTCS